MIIELRAGSPAPAGFILIGRGIEKIKPVPGKNKLLVDVYEKQ